MAPLAQTLALLAMILPSTAILEFSLDMAPKSFDDQYLNCGPNMIEAFLALHSSELQQNKNFAQVWVKAMALWEKRDFYLSNLAPAQAIALMAYTMKDVYREFNAAVREAGNSSQEYRDNFHFKTLHFLLTRALQKLRDPNDCQNVFRGVRGKPLGVYPGKKVRFGHFTSSSQSKAVTHHYGRDTLFQVYTCYGVDIQNFAYDKSQREVLIPPFETFEVTNVTTEGNTLKIRLRSTGTFSKYNCEWQRGGSLPRNSPDLGGLLLATVAMAVAIGTL